MPIASILPRRTSFRRLRSFVESRTVGVLLLLALLAAVLLGVTGPHVIGGHHGRPEHVAEATAKKYAYEAYTQWSMRTGRHCPSDLVDLNAYMNNQDTEDPWGREYRMRCRPPTLARRASGIVVVSAGPDRRFGTDDDISSDRWSRK
jgi:hypothetical protein